MRFYRGGRCSAILCFWARIEGGNDKNMATYSLNINDAKCTELIRFGGISLIHRI